MGQAACEASLERHCRLLPRPVHIGCLAERWWSRHHPCPCRDHRPHAPSIYFDAFHASASASCVAVQNRGAGGRPPSPSRSETGRIPNFSGLELHLTVQDKNLATTSACCLPLPAFAYRRAAGAASRQQQKRKLSQLTGGNAVAIVGQTRCGISTRTPRALR